MAARGLVATRNLFLVTAGYAALAILAYGLLGGWAADSHWLSFPHCLAYWIPLLVPFTTYLIIAHWTGMELFRYS